jgi:hypothetical protein
VDDLARTLRLPGGFFQCAQQVFFGDLLGLDARHHAVAIVVDGGERLVEFVRHAGGHFTHGDEATCGLGAFGLAGGLFFSQTAPRGDIGGNHHLGQTPVHPTQVACAHLQPFVQVGDEDLGALGFRVGKRRGWQTGK